MSDYFLRTLFVHTPGTRLVLEGDAVRALADDRPPRRLPLRAIDAIVVAGGVDVSTPLLVRCAEDGRLVAFVGRYGRPRAIVSGAFDGRGRLRRSQYAAHFDEDVRIRMSASIVRGKGLQMSWGLRQWARDLDPPTDHRLREMATTIEHQLPAGLDDPWTRESLMGVEGATTRLYFEGLAVALRERNWPGRKRRPARDPVNATLSFLYGMARIAVHGGLEVAGLDPYCGFLHGDADSQPALVLDLLEEFRPTVDRVVVTMFNRHQLTDSHFEIDALGSCFLTAEGREVVMAVWHAHRMGKVAVRGAVAPMPRAALPVVQAYAMANALRHGMDYEPHRLPVT